MGSNLYVELKKNLIDTKNRLSMVLRAGELGIEETGKGNIKVKTSRYKINM